MPTKLFLDACTAILPLLGICLVRLVVVVFVGGDLVCVDTLGGTTFAPVKMDINGNITVV